MVQQFIFTTTASYHQPPWIAAALYNLLFIITIFLTYFLAALFYLKTSAATNDFVVIRASKIKDSYCFLLNVWLVFFEQAKNCARHHRARQEELSKEHHQETYTHGCGARSERPNRSTSWADNGAARCNNMIFSSSQDYDNCERAAMLQRSWLIARSQPVSRRIVTRSSTTAAIIIIHWLSWST